MFAATVNEEIAASFGAVIVNVLFEADPTLDPPDVYVYRVTVHVPVFAFGIAGQKSAFVSILVAE